MQSAFDPDVARHRRERLALLFGLFTTLVLILAAIGFLHERGLVTVPGLPESVLPGALAPAEAKEPAVSGGEVEQVDSTVAEKAPSVGAWELERKRLLSPTASSVPDSR